MFATPGVVSTSLKSPARSFKAGTLPRNKRLGRISEAFIISEEEGSILSVVDLRYDDGPPEGKPELVEPERGERRWRPIEVAACIYGRVPDVFKHTAMELVCAGFCDHVNHSARVASDVGAVKIRLDLEFAYCGYGGGRTTMERVRRSLSSTPSIRKLLSPSRLPLENISNAGRLLSGRVPLSIVPVADCPTPVTPGLKVAN